MESKKKELIHISWLGFNLHTITITYFIFLNFHRELKKRSGET
jgi:hypothetical protein